MSTHHDAYAPPRALTLRWILRATGGRLRGTESLDTEVRITTDSRRSEPGRLFVALVGERHDAHRFVAAARAAGAAVLVRRSHPTEAGGGPVIEVDDTGEALLAIGAALVAEFDGPVVTLTGSAGKTTTKEMVASILTSALGPGLATVGNFNNAIGVPLTLLRLAPEHRWMVLEMGMNAEGEIRTLSHTAPGRVRLVTNVAAVHLEGLGSLAGVARAKGEIFEGLRVGDRAVVNGDDPSTARFPLGAHTPLRFSLRGQSEAEVRLVSREPLGALGQRLRIHTPAGEIEFQLSLLGQHAAANAVAATAVAHALGIERSAIRRGLSRVQPPPGRGQLVRLECGAWLIDDSYNANPTAVRAALASARELAGPNRLFVALGDMLELGADEVAYHREMGRAAAGRGVARLYGSGVLSRHTVDEARAAGLEARWIEQLDEAALDLLPDLREGDVVLVKGSRGARMERFSAPLRARAAKGA